MSLIEIIIIGIVLSMDASAVSMCNGMLESKMKVQKSIFIAITFGVFQGVMPIIGYYLGSLFSDFIADISHYIAFGILFILGLKIIWESRKRKCELEANTQTIFIQAIATSLDALIVGITFVMLQVNIVNAAIIITIITSILCFIAIKVGNTFGALLQNKVEVFGGIILIFIAFHNLIDGLFI